MEFQREHPPLISVVMPLFNTAQFLPAALESVLNQTYQNLQVIVVDDCSTDGSAEILASYDDPRLEIFRMEENSHVCAARNEGFRHVRGDYVATIDSDDVWLPEKLEMQLSWMEIHPDCGVCFTWSDMIDENGALANHENAWFYEMFRQPNRTQREWLLHLLEHGNCLNNSSPLMRRAVLDQVGGYNLTLVQLQDFEYWIRVVSKFPISVLPAKLVQYRRVRENNRSVSANNVTNKLRSENEEIFVCSHFFDWISDELFCELFRSDFRDSNASAAAELQCERVFLLRRAYCAPEPYLSRMQMLLCEPETTAVLRKNYHYRPKDFYGENRVKRYFGRGLQLRQREEIEIEKATLCFALPDGASETIEFEKDPYVYERAGDRLICDAKIPAGAVAVIFRPIQCGSCILSELHICADRESLLAEEFTCTRIGDHWVYEAGKDTIFYPLPAQAERLTVSMRRTLIRAENEFLLGAGEHAFPTELQVCMKQAKQTQEEMTERHRARLRTMAQEQREQRRRMNEAHQQELAQLRQEKANVEGECRQLRDTENRLLNDIDAIHHSRSWRIAQFFSRILRFFIPIGSKRALFCRILWMLIRHPVIFFRNLTPRKIKKALRMMRRGDTEGVRLLMRGKVTGEPAPSSIVTAVPELAAVDMREKTIDDYQPLAVPQWDDPTVSIVIPVYNQFEFTYHCVESILKHSGDVTYEILIANDCSTDLTTEIDKILPGVRCITNEQNLRFLRNCNRAAGFAKGKYILFLNNDTQVQPDWLRPLVTLIESAPDVGLVGSKLIYPDGKLQEAGGILWRDGSAWNFGNRQNPALPQFNYVKQVDYISGAAIMLSRRLWEEIGGFDETFAPAYCEDSDLCFTVRKLGYRVLYQPLSVVVHFEGVSNGTDTSSGQKKYQIENSKKFREKWAEELAKHPENGENVFQARDYSYEKKTLLMVDHYVPQFDRDAGSRTVFQYLKLFVSQGFNVKFIGDNFYQHEPYTTVLQQLGIEVLYGPECAAHWKDWIIDNAEHFDYVFLNRPHIAPKYLDFLRLYTHARIMYYGHDLAFLREMREYEVTGDASFRDSAKEWMPKELALMREADMAYYPSYVEVDEIHKLDPDIRVKAIPAYLFENVEWEGYDFAARKDIMFIGGFGHRPNVDAVKWLAEDILPALRKLLPGVKIHVLGSNPPKEVQALASSDLIIEGFVTDEQLDAFYRESRISLVPLRYGAGIKGKVIEAMRNGTPVVTTPTGAEGIKDAESVMAVEETAEALAKRIAGLYNDEAALTELSRRSVDYVKKNYSPANAIQVIGPEFDLT